MEESIEADNGNAVIEYSQFAKTLHSNGISLNKLLEDVNFFQPLQRLSLRDVHQDESVIHILKMFHTLGIAAKEDLNSIAKMRSSKVEDVQYNNGISQTEEDVKNIEKSDEWSCFKKLQEKCCDLIREINTHLTLFFKQQFKGTTECGRPSVSFKEQDIISTQLPFFIENVHSLESSLKEMMVSFRRIQALRHAGLTECSAAVEQLETTNQQLNEIFRDAYTLVESCGNVYTLVKTSTACEEIKTCLHSLNKTLKANGQFIEQQPPCCIKVTDVKDKKKTSDSFKLSIRVFGMKQGTHCLGPLEIFLCHESQWKSHDEHIREKQPPMLVEQPSERKMSESDQGILVELNVNIENYQRCKGRTSPKSYAHFDRIGIVLNFTALPEKFESEIKIECLSLPFTVVTGSNQIWPYTGAVVWYCWIQKDLYSTPFKCPSEMSFSQLLAMIQAKLKYINSDLYLNEENVLALQNILKSLKKCKQNNNMIDMHSLLQMKMPKQGNHTNGEHTFSCYTWLEAAFNTINLFQSYAQKGVLWSFLSHRQCVKLLKGKSVGTAIVRISLNNVEKEDSISPYAALTVHSNYNNNTVVEKALKVRDLYIFLSSLKNSEKEILIENLITSVVGDNVPLSELIPSSKPVRNATMNDYLTKTSKHVEIICSKDDAEDEKVTEPNLYAESLATPPKQLKYSAVELPPDLVDVEPMITKNIINFERGNDPMFCENHEHSNDGF
ncbi:uncharacterized protein LOC131944012 [Physella acuta]|uniref:uncharacterized protein LOC131944012 n=1 Tax=Physella acuta TaxID=109671 RepID=UPI0027DB4A40|nr:uncharacterized protein LOC131944012 [Physella acuta]